VTKARAHGAEYAGRPAGVAAATSPSGAGLAAELRQCELVVPVPVSVSLFAALVVPAAAGVGKERGIPERPLCVSLPISPVMAPVASCWTLKFARR
jgi:hypothetical protein